MILSGMRIEKKIRGRAMAGISQMAYWQKILRGKDLILGSKRGENQKA